MCLNVYTFIDEKIKTPLINLIKSIKLRKIREKKRAKNELY